MRIEALPVAQKEVRQTLRDPRTLFVLVLYNPTLDSRVYFVPGVAATLLLVVTFIVTAMGLAREKEAGTLEQILVTPLPPSALVLGKTLPYAAVGMLDLALVVGAGAAIFGAPLRGSPLLLALAGGEYLLTTLGLGLLVASIARNQQQAFISSSSCPWSCPPAS